MHPSKPDFDDEAGLDFDSASEGDPEASSLAGSVRQPSQALTPLSEQNMHTKDTEHCKSMPAFWQAFTPLALISACRGHTAMPMHASMQASHASCDILCTSTPLSAPCTCVRCLLRAVSNVMHASIQPLAL